MASNITHAQPSSRFPDHHTVYLEDERYEAFDLGSFTELLEIDADLQYYAEYAENLETQLDLYRERHSDMILSLSSLEDDVQLLQEERDRLHGMWVEENRRRLECENSPDILSWIGWGSAAALAVVSVVLGSILAVGE